VRPFPTLRYTKRGRIAVVALDRPERLNAYSMQMRDDLFAVLGAVDEDPDVRVMVLCGRGGAFSVGGDLREFGRAPSPVVAREVRWQRDVWGRLLAVRAATVAAVHGYAVGGGLEMTLLCDLCVAANGARFALPETGLGMIPGVGGTQTLPRRIGLARALEVVLADRWISAGEAARLGIVNRVVPTASLLPSALAMARRLAAIEPNVVRAARRCVRAAHDLDLAAGIELERRLVLALERAR